MSKWTQEEDSALCRAWIAMAALGPRVRGFWNGVSNEMACQYGVVRSVSSIMSRWRVVSMEVKSYIPSYVRARRLRTLDVDSTAMRLFRESTGHGFELMHCWQELRTSPLFTSGSRDKQGVQTAVIHQKQKPLGQLRQQQGDLLPPELVQRAIERQQPTKRTNELDKHVAPKRRPPEGPHCLEEAKKQKKRTKMQLKLQKHFAPSK